MRCPQRLNSGWGAGTVNSGLKAILLLSLWYPKLEIRWLLASARNLVKIMASCAFQMELRYWRFIKWKQEKLLGKEEGRIRKCILGDTGFLRTAVVLEVGNQSLPRCRAQVQTEFHSQLFLKESMLLTGPAPLLSHWAPPQVRGNASAQGDAGFSDCDTRDGCCHPSSKRAGHEGSSVPSSLGQLQNPPVQVRVLQAGTAKGRGESHKRVPRNP